MSDFISYDYLRGSGYGCAACGPDVWCPDDAGEDYGPVPDQTDTDDADDVQPPTAPAPRFYPDEEPF